MLRFTVTCACGKIILHRLFQDNDLGYARLVSRRTSGGVAGGVITPQALHEDVPVEALLDHLAHGGFFVAHGPANGMLFQDEDSVTAPMTPIRLDTVSRHLQADCDGCGARLHVMVDGLRQTVTLVCPTCCLPRQQYPYDAVRAAQTETRILLGALPEATPLLQTHVARLALDVYAEDTLRRLAKRGDSWTLSRELGSTTAAPRTKALARLAHLRLVESRPRPGYGGSVFTQHQYRVTMIGARLAIFYAWRERFTQDLAQERAGAMA